MAVGRVLVSQQRLEVRRLRQRQPVRRGGQRHSQPEQRGRGARVGHHPRRRGRHLRRPARPRRGRRQGRGHHLRRGHRVGLGPPTPTRPRASSTTTSRSFTTAAPRAAHHRPARRPANEIQAQVDDLEERIATIRQPLTDVEQQLQANPGNTSLESRRDDLTAPLASQPHPARAAPAPPYQQQLESLAAGRRLRASRAALGSSPRPTVPSDPVAPKPVQNAILALIVGLMLGVVARLPPRQPRRAHPRHRRPRPRRPGPAHAGGGARGDDPRPRATWPCATTASSLTAEAYRSLRTSVKFAGLDQPIRVIQVTSALQGEGKTTTVANLAEALAQGGERVAIVCCDLRRPAIHLALRPVAHARLHRRDARATPPLATAMRADQRQRLFLLPAGSPPPNPSELLSSAPGRRGDPGARRRSSTW